MYSVTPRYQPAKDKFESSVYNENQGAYYAIIAIGEIKDGNYNDANNSFATSDKYIHIGNAEILEFDNMTMG